VLLFLEDVDILDGTPLLDIKPYFPQYDAPEGARAGWAENISADVALERGRRAFSAPKRLG
jgi:tRNA (Thr-GGU) A37 N-methylase